MGANEDEEFIQLIDVIDCLPPGLFEMVITPKKNGEAKLTPESSDVSFEPRTLDDLRALGRIARRTTVPSPRQTVFPASISNSTGRSFSLTFAPLLIRKPRLWREPLTRSG